MGTNDHTSRWANRCTETSHPPKGQNFGNLGDHSTGTNTSISQSGRRDLVGDSAKGSEFCFSFQALACKVQRLQAKLERCRKAEGGRGAGGKGGVSNTRHPGLTLTKAVSSPNLIPAPPPGRQTTPAAPSTQLPPPASPTAPRQRQPPGPGRAPGLASLPRGRHPAGLPPSPPGRAGGAEPGRAPPPTPPAPGPARAPAYLGARRGGGGLKVASLPPPASLLRARFLPPSSSSSSSSPLCVRGSPSSPRQGVKAENPEAGPACVRAGGGGARPARQ